MPITVLSVSPRREDHAALSRILASRQSPSCPGSEWHVAGFLNIDSSLSLIAKQDIPVVLCDHDLGRESWKHLLDRLAEFPTPPCFIVTARTADESLWAEALNLGAYDVLAKPLDPDEVMRTIGLAWLRWNAARQESESAPIALSAVP